MFDGMMDNMPDTVTRKSILSTLYFVQEGSAVERYHTRPGLKPDTVGRHSHGVAMLCHLLSGPEGASPQLLLAALTHDLAEQVASDISAPSKWLMGNAASFDKLETDVLNMYDLSFFWKLTPPERQVLKVADAFDCMMWACREYNYGNRYARLIFGRMDHYIHKNWGPELESMTDIQREAYASIRRMYESTQQNDSTSYDCYRGVNDGSIE